MKYKFLPSILSLFNIGPVASFPDSAAASGKQWIGLGVSDRWSEPTNWYPVGVPAINDRVIFGNLSNNNCWVDVDTEQLTSFNVLRTYSGNIDCSVASINVNEGFGYSGEGRLIGGVADFNIGGPILISGANVSLGSSRWNMSANQMTINSRTLTTDESLLVVPSGTSTELSTPEIANLNIYGSLAMMRDTSVKGNVYAMGELVSEYGLSFEGERANLFIGKNGQAYGDGSFNLRDKAGIPANSGYLSFNVMNIFDEHGAIGGIASGSFYGGRVNFINSDGTDTLYLRGGKYIFASPVSFRNSGVAPYRVDNSQFNPNLEFQSSVDFATVDGGSFEWIRGTGTITLGGASVTLSQIGFSGGPIETVQILTSGTKTLTNHLQTRNLYFDAGTFSLSGKNVTTQGIFYSAPTAQFISGGWTGSNVVVSGNLSLNGSGLKLDSPGSWSLRVTGNTIVRNARVANSDASLGNTVYAYNSVNVGNNTNWSFSQDSGTAALNLTVWNGVSFLETNPFTLAASGGQNPRPLDLYIKGFEGTSSGVLYLNIYNVDSGNLDKQLYLTVQGGSLSGLYTTLPIYIANSGVYSNLFLYIRGNGISDGTITASGSTWLMIRNDGVDASLPAYILGHDTSSGIMYLNTFGVVESSGNLYMYVKGADVPNKRLPLYIRGF